MCMNHRKTDKNTLRLAIATVAIVVFCFIVLPLLILMFRALPTSQQAIRDLTYSNMFRESVVHSIGIAILTTALSTAISIFFIYAIDYLRIRGSSIFATIAKIPLLFSGIPIVMIYKIVFTNYYTALNSSLIGSYVKTVAAILYSLIPIQYLGLQHAYHNMDYALIEESLLLGVSEQKSFVKVVIPCIRNSLITTIIFVFINAFSAYSAPAMLGNTGFHMATGIIISFFRLSSRDLSMAYAIMIVLIEGVLLLCTWIIPKRTVVRSGRKLARSLVCNTGKNHAIESLVTMLLCLLLSAPWLFAFIYSFADSASIGLGLPPRVLSLTNFKSIINNAKVYPALINTIKIAVPVMLCTVLLALLINYICINSRKASGLFFLLFFVGGTISPVIVALSYLISYPRKTWLSLRLVGIGSNTSLIVALIVTTVYFLSMRIEAAYMDIDREYIDASIQLTGKVSYTYRKLLLPLLLPIVVETLPIIFSRIITDYTLTEMLYTPQNKPLSMVFQSFLTQTEYQAQGDIFGLAMVLFSMIAVAYFISRILLRRYFKTYGRRN